MIRHAYLIMADFDIDQLIYLLKSIDDIRNDIYLHVDLKVNLDEEKKVKILRAIKKSKLVFIKRMLISWGGISIMKCEFLLFKEAYKSGKYLYYHMLSGKDLPLMTQDEIHVFFAQNKNKRFVEFKELNKEVSERVKFFHLFPEISAYRCQNKLVKFVIRLYRKLERDIQRSLKVNFLKKTKLGFGSQWVSLDELAVKRLLDKQKFLEQLFKHTLLCDELFVQTFILNDKELLKGTINNNLRYLRIEEGKSSPEILTMKDYPILKYQRSKNKLFARKFDVHSEEKFVKKWYRKELKSE